MTARRDESLHQSSALETPGSAQIQSSLFKALIHTMVVDQEAERRIGKEARGIDIANCGGEGVDRCLSGCRSHDMTSIQQQR